MRDNQASGQQGGAAQCLQKYNEGQRMKVLTLEKHAYFLPCQRHYLGKVPAEQVQKQ
jgi:hypothetical protein